VREIEKNKFSNDRNPDRGNTFDDEEPAPAFDSVGIVQATSNSTCKKAAECSRENGSTVEDSKSFAWRC
jgi:hypothetical protein